MQKSYANDFKYLKVANEENKATEVHPCPVSKPGLGLDLWCLYTNQKFCDVTLNVQEKTFHVHKSILCARSRVFRTMFENCTMESKTGIVDIADVDPDTIEDMISYMYTDQSNFRDVHSTLLLYRAADKYEVMLLRTECVVYLKSNFNVTNVLEVLSLAYLHEDEALKSPALDFIASNATETFKSSQWKTLVREEGSVAVDVMDFIFFKKEMICTKKHHVFPLYHDMYDHWRS